MKQNDIKIAALLPLYRPFYIIISCAFLTSARDPSPAPTPWWWTGCSGNPASHHILLFLYLYYKYLQWCDADPAPAHSPRCWTSCSDRADIGGLRNNEILFISEYLALEFYLNYYSAPDRLSAPVEGEPEKAPKQIPPRNPVYSNQRFSLSAQRLRSEATTNNLGRNLQYTYGGTTGSQLIEAKNPLGQTTTTEYDPITDQEIKTIDPNGVETITTYDALGRPKEVYLDGMKVQSTSYEWTGTKYITTTTLHSREGDSWTKTTTDKDGNELKTESLVFNNITSTRETEYDSLGRVHRTSHEYLTGESPTWTTTEYYSQAEDIEERPKRIVSNTGEVSELSYTAFTTTITVSKDSELLRTEILENDAFGQLKKKTVQDKAIEYSYNTKGQLVQVKDPGTGLTTMEYDFAGNKIKQTDQNSGDTTYTYNIAGELISQTDARGITQTFNLDGLGRITKIQTNTPEPPTTFTYDTANSLNGSNTIGKLTRITDASGTTELAYDNRGNSIVEKRTIDDLTLLFQRTYDDLNRVKTLIYPEGTKLTNMYTPSGKLLTILMDSHDGSSRNHPVVTYTGPIQRDGKVYLQRKTGNNVEMDIEVDPLYRRPKSIQTKLSDGHIEQKISYQYDKKGNITKITNHFHEDRNQEFEYDAVNRITKAKGKYGEETYSYHKNGNLLKRGQFNLQYNNPNHIHAVTRADSPQTGLVNYQYDSVGNLIQRNGDIYRYNATGKLQEITTEGGDKFTYTYDHLGNRIKKHLQNANTTTYSFGDLYEIHRAPGEPEKHTMYITGMQGDKVSQYSRPDAMLRTSSEVLSANRLTLSAEEERFAGVLINAFWNTPKSVYLEMERDLAMVYHGLPSIALFKDSGVPKPIAKIFFWLFCLTLLLYYAVKLKSENPRIIRITSAIATYAFFFASGYGCTPLFYGGAQTEEGIPPWLLGLAIPGNTQSVSDAPGNYGGGGGAVGGGQSTARIPGMFFYHPDHLGSITMITDGHGQVLAGGERGGKSHISYRPYGEIFRTDSFGPDISKYKYTGQEEDKESGLYYYKARYYDPVIGRFAQADSMIFPDKISGMNRFMYVSGNPMIFNDPTGNIDVGHMVSQIIKHMVGGLKAAAKHTKGTIDRISKGKSSRRGGNDFEKTGRKLKEAGTFMRRLATDPLMLPGLILISIEMTLGSTIALIKGDPLPKLHYTNGGYWVENSQVVVQVNNYISNLIGGINAAGLAIGPSAFTPPGTSLDTILHEKGHINQYMNRGGYNMMQWGSRNLTELERANDIGSGFTHGYGRIYLYLQIARAIAKDDEDFRNLASFLLLRYFLMENIL